MLHFSVLSIQHLFSLSHTIGMQLFAINRSTSNDVASMDTIEDNGNHFYSRC